MTFAVGRGETKAGRVGKQKFPDREKDVLQDKLAATLEKK